MTNLTILIFNKNKRNKLFKRLVSFFTFRIKKKNKKEVNIVIVALFILMALLITLFGVYVLVQKAKEEEKTSRIMQPQQYNYYGMPNPNNNIHNYRREINEPSHTTNSSTNSNTNKIKIEIEQTNQDQNQIQINIDPKAKNNNVDTTIKNSPQLAHYQQKLIDNNAHRPANINRHSNYRTQSFTKNIPNVNRSNTPLYNPKSEVPNKKTAISKPIKNTAHRPRKTSAVSTSQKNTKPLFVPSSPQTISKPKPLTKKDKHQQEIINALNKQKEKSIHQSDDKSKI